MGIVIPGWTWHKELPVAPSDTHDNIGGFATADASSKQATAVAIVNRSASTILANIVQRQTNASTGAAEERATVYPIPGYGSIGGCSRWTRVNATGTTGGGTSGAAYELIHTTGNGAAFTNQPANDGVEIVSSSAADTTQSITIYYNRNGQGDTLFSETKVLTGTTQVSLAATDVTVVLGVTLSAVCAGTITVREASANATITTITAGNTTSGVESVATARSYPTTAPYVVASGATTKQIGIYGTTVAGVAGGDSQALTGTTPVIMNAGFGSETLLLTGDLESNRTVSVYVTSDLLALY